MQINHTTIFDTLRYDTTKNLHRYRVKTICTIFLRKIPTLICDYTSKRQRNRKVKQNYYPAQIIIVTNPKI